MASQANSPKHLEKSNTYHGWTLSENCRMKTPKFILQGDHHPDLFLNGGQSLYNVVLVSAVLQCECYKYNISFSSWASLPPSPANSLSHHRAPAELPVLYSSFSTILYMVVYFCQCYSLNLSHPLLLPLCPQVHSLFLHLYSCPENRFISTIF